MKPTNCHIVPRVYQKAWENAEEKIFYFNKDKTFNSYCTSEFMMSSPDYYHDGVSAEKLEGFLSKEFETNWEKLVSTLSRATDILPKTQKQLKNILVTNKQIKHLDRFVGSQYLRIKENTRHISNQAIIQLSDYVLHGTNSPHYDEVTKLIKSNPHLENNILELKKLSKEQIVNGYKAMLNDPGTHDTLWVDGLLKGADKDDVMTKTFNIFSVMNITLAHINYPATQFILSDNPVRRLSNAIIFPITTKWSACYYLDSTTKSEIDVCIEKGNLHEYSNGHRKVSFEEINHLHIVVNANNDLLLQSKNIFGICADANANKSTLLSNIF